MVSSAFTWMVLEPKQDPSTDGIENDGVERVSYTCNESHHNKEHVNVDMPPANGHLNERQRQPLLGLCKQLTSAVSNGVGWEPRNDSNDSNQDNREHQQSDMGHTHPATVDNKHLSNSGTTTEINVEYSKKYLNNNGANGSAVHIDIPSNGNGTLASNQIIPQEKFKTLVAFILLIVNFLITTTSLAVVHEKVPDRRLYKPLPDTFLDAVSPRDWALDVSEIFIIISTNLSLLIIASHKYRLVYFITF